MALEVTPLTDCVLLGEGPHWDADKQCLFFVSIPDHTIHKYVPETGKETRTKLDDTVSFIVPVAGTADLFAVGVGRKLLLLEWDGQQDSTVTVVKQIVEVDEAEGKTTNRFNDGKADPRGRLIAGTMGKENPPGQFEKGKGSLFSLGKGGAVELADKVDLSNGLCWDERRGKMYYIDSLKFSVDAFDYDFNTGGLSNRKAVIDFKAKEIEGIPDGMTIDTDGNLWVAVFNGSCVLQIDPSKGEVIRTVKIPAPQVTSVAFGGSNLDELYVTTARVKITEEQLPPCGALFRVTGLGVKGHAAVPCII